MKTVPEIFDHLGGASRVARLLGVGQSTASEMKRRRSIPVKWWPALLSDPAAIEAGLTESALIRIHTEPADRSGEAA